MSLNSFLKCIILFNITIITTVFTFAPDQFATRMGTIAAQFMRSFNGQ